MARASEADPSVCGPSGVPPLGPPGLFDEHAELTVHERSILAVEQEFARMVAGARRAMRARATAMDPSLLPFDFKVIGALWHHDTHDHSVPGVTAKELVDMLETDKSMVSRSLKRLEEIGFVQREQDPRDARAQLIRLTSAAADAYESTSRTQRAVVQERLRSWSTEQVQQLAQLLLKLNGPRPEDFAMDLSGEQPTTSA